MVLKAQIFMTDATVALIIIMIATSFSIQKTDNAWQHNLKTYENTALDVKLLQASELLLTDSEKGFVKYENGASKHHEIDVSKVKLDKKTLLLEDYDVCLTITSFYGNCTHYSNKIVRFAVCNNEPCKLELSAK